MSLPQMRNLGFQLELTPEKAFLSCDRIGVRKMVLRTAISTHLILDLQGIAWYMGQVYFKTPTVKSFFSQTDHFEYSQITVQHDHEEEGDASQDYWQVDPMRRELIRHHRDKRTLLHEMTRAPKPPIPNIPKEQLLDERETRIEYIDNKKKEVKKDNWRDEKKRFTDKPAGPWKGKSIYKIKDDYEIPEDIVKSDLDRAKPFRGNIDDIMFPDESSSSKPSGVQKKSGSSSEEVVKKQKGPSSKRMSLVPNLRFDM